MRLTKAEAEEIYYAVTLKRELVFNGDYGTGEVVNRWVTELDALIRKIGLDGKNLYYALEAWRR